MNLEFVIARTHLLARKRHTLVSLSGIVLGVAFFLAVAALMQGSEVDFIHRLIDTSPHITVSDDYRSVAIQPAERRWPEGAVAIAGVKPQVETRGIRGYQQKLAFIGTLPGVRVAPVLTGSAVLTLAGRLQGVSLSGVVPAQMKNVSAIEEDIIEGSLDALAANPNGIIIGARLATKFDLAMDENITITMPDGSVRTLRIVGIFRSGNAGYDETQTFVLLKRAQTLLNRPNRVNRFIIQLEDPYTARDVAGIIESRIGYESVSWLEASEDLMALLTVRNIIMYSVVAAILVVASFGIYNTISTIVMEKTRDIAIMKSMGFHARDIRTIFIVEGIVLGILGSVLGVLLSLGLIWVLAQIEIKPPGVEEVVPLPLYRNIEQYLIAIGFALASSIGAAYLPARRGARTRPVDILRGAT